MPRSRQWVLFVDDTGDPGERGSPHFGFAGLLVERGNLSRLGQVMSTFRVNHSVFDEFKARYGHPHFRHVIEEISRLCVEGSLRAGAVMIMKNTYDGPWLRDTADRVKEPTFLRNYLIRKLSEVVFQDVSTDRSSDGLEIVIDRVDYSDEQMLNLRRYLNGDFADFGVFDFPHVRHITHADSRYVEALQLADHLAELAHQIATDSGNDECLQLEVGFYKCVRLSQVASSRCAQRLKGG